MSTPPLRRTPRYIPSRLRIRSFLFFSCGMISLQSHWTLSCDHGRYIRSMEVTQCDVQRTATDQAINREPRHYCSGEEPKLFRSRGGEERQHQPPPPLASILARTYSRHQRPALPRSCTGSWKFWTTELFEQHRAMLQQLAESRCLWFGRTNQNHRDVAAVGGWRCVVRRVQLSAFPNFRCTNRARRSLMAVRS